MENQTRELARKDESAAKKQTNKQKMITLEVKFKLNGSGIREEMECWHRPIGYTLDIQPEEFSER